MDSQPQPPEGEQEDTSVHGPLDHSFPLPQELVDLIIDVISGDRHEPGRERRTLVVATLRACSLVAKAWTIRAQRSIFQWVELHDATILHSFAEAIRASPHLAADVQRLTLLRRSRDPPNSLPCYSPDCAEVLFPAVLADLLPNLRYLAFDELPSSPLVPSATWLRPYVPIHPRFPLLLSSSGFSELRELHLAAIVFQTFNDFARMLHAFKKLRVLYCGDIEWVTPGVLLPSFMTPMAAPRSTQFLPALESFAAVTMGQHGPERLLSGLALTASLCKLTVYLPYMGTLHHTGPSIDPATGRPDGLDLSPFPHLSEVTILSIMPYSFRPMQLSMLSVLHDMLASWNTPSSRSLSLWIKPSPYSNQSERFYTKQNYLNFLGAIARTIKACTFSRSSTIPELYVHLEIPQNAQTPLEELEREAISRFSMTSKAEKLTVEAYTSEDDFYSWKSRTLHTNDTSERENAQPASPDTDPTPPLA